ncbi:flagellar export protein FliJ [Shewanella sp. NFH-SH190041]|uniref:flagellar export protein FliJ n=1 Tax=Shewanella sp. NFH-SH190041 TaxID=2950245 RepID=UPI0021C42FCF|nr:flagellar export protein FliJ [Shewanella sp. NFH-SH190041]BDM63804.1 flagellar export protein FliJ [Shewanella sp. NFH-SH190041]
MKDPLNTVLNLINDAEQQAALQLQAVRLRHQQAEQQLASLNQYRLDYLKQLDARSQQQISATFYHQLHKFIRQLDEAIARQCQALQQTAQQVEQARQHWLAQQQKRQAIETLLEQKALKRSQQVQRQEQRLADELALRQRYLRR